MQATNVYLTVDVEMWPPRWDASSREYAESFRRYIHGVGNPARYGLPYQLKVLSDHGLRGVFFVEPLFSSVLGRAALEEVVGLVLEAGQEVQLHIHPEWLGRAGHPDLPGPPRMLLRQLPEEHQLALLRLGAEWLADCGVSHIRAFRAGGFGADRATLRAVRRAGLAVDASYNPAAVDRSLVPASGSVPSVCEGVIELPLTTFRDAFGRLRGLQIGSCSCSELIAVCHRAEAASYGAVSILSHSAELLNGARSRRDPVVLRRFWGFCRFLDRNRERFPTRGLGDLSAPALAVDRGSDTLTCSSRATIRRYLEQAIRRVLSPTAA